MRRISPFWIFNKFRKMIGTGTDIKKIVKKAADNDTDAPAPATAAIWVAKHRRTVPAKIRALNKRRRKVRMEKASRTKNFAVAKR